MKQTDSMYAQGSLYIVATPIGNLEDITFRAVRILKQVDLVAAEDTRHSRKLFSHYGIHNKLVSYHEHNEQWRVPQLIEKLQGGSNIALISDAGTPCIADPGYRLVKAARAEGVRVVSVPGPSALLAALSIAGLPTDRFLFEGYLPAKKKARIATFQGLRTENRTMVFYESPHRLAKTLSDMLEVFGADRHIAVARELTKVYEEVYSGRLEEAFGHFSGVQVKGELVLILSAVQSETGLDMAQTLRKLLAEGELSRREIAKIIAREFNISSSEAYRASLHFEADENDEI